MSKGYTVAPWRPIPDSGQSLAVSNGSSSTFANAVGPQTRAVWLSLAPTATPTGCLVLASQEGEAATATQELLVKTTDPGIVFGCSPGDKISAYGLAACTLYLTELTN